MKHFERRTRPRLRLRLPVLLLRNESDAPVWTETADISNNGFYCNTPQPFAPGDEFRCIIVLPTHCLAPSNNGERLYLEAKVEVVRIAMNESSGFGIGCEIRHFHVLTSQKLPPWARADAENKRIEAIIEQPV